MYSSTPYFGAVLSAGAPRLNLSRLPFCQPNHQKRVLIRRAAPASREPNGRVEMMRSRVICLFVAIAASSCLATGQNSLGGSSSAKDPIETANKALTPKSAMPVHRKSSITPKPQKSGPNTTAELIHLEQQTVKASPSKSATVGAMKETPKATGTFARNGSGINFKYQKPVGGPQAPNGGGNSKTSGTPRVKKN